MNYLAVFQSELDTALPMPERLALAIAGLAYPELDIDQQMRELDMLVRIVGKPPADMAHGQKCAVWLVATLYQKLGFVGNRDNYYDPRNSYLNDVMVRKTGLPILLSVLYMAVGRRIGLDVEGIGFPGHFMASFRDESGTWLLDPFYGEVLELEEANDYLSGLFGQPIVLTREMFVPITAVDLAQRILNNLRNVYLSAGEFDLAGSVLDYMLAIDSASPHLWQERGLLHYQSEEWEKAERALRRYFFLVGKLELTFGFVEDEEEDGYEDLGKDDRQLLEIIEEIEETRLRLN